jgi:glyoxylase-like metal-dependent hydrolase (beta-lactamase superfamily II)
MTAPDFINSATIRAPERLLLRGGSWRSIAVGVRYGLMVHPDLGPVLIDTGYGPRATEGSGRGFLLKTYGAILRPVLDRQGAPAAALARLGFAAADVRRIVVTHFHADHIAALRDFPNATFITSGEAVAQIGAMSASSRIRNGIFDELLPTDFAARVLPLEACAQRHLPFGLGAGHDIFGDGTCLAVDLPGHGIGHFGLVWPKLSPPLLYGVDATWLSEALALRLPAGIVTAVYHDRVATVASAARVRAFGEAGGRVVLCHDRVPQ